MKTKERKEEKELLQDGNKRIIDYMRLSVTDHCNLHCMYCMPENDRNFLPKEEVLSWDEMYTVCKIMSEIGIKKIKVTGGEPLVRAGVIEFIKKIKKLPGMECVTLTTNGILLKEKLLQLKSAGIDGINISMDSMDGQVYESITGQDKAENVWEAIRLSMEYAIPTKINCVVLKDVNEEEMVSFAQLTKTYPLVVRFIEMMPIGEGNRFQSVSGVELKKTLEKSLGLLSPVKDVKGNGPAVYYRGKGFQGSIGFINAVSQCFCSSCNRIRMSADGQLKLCLSHSDSWDMRQALRENQSEDEIKKVLKTILKKKPIGHDFQFHTKDHEAQSMWKIGG